MNLSFPILLDHLLCLIQYSLGLFIILMIWLRESLGCARSGRKLPSYGWLEITLIVDVPVDIVTFILRRSGEDVEYDRLTETTNKVVFHVKMGKGGICSTYFDARLNRRRLVWEKKRRWC